MRGAHAPRTVHTQSKRTLSADFRPTRWLLLGLGALIQVSSAGADSGTGANSNDNRQLGTEATLAPFECTNPYLDLRKAPIGGLWLAGDTHVHDDHSSDGSLPRQQSKQRLPGNLAVGDQIGQAERTGLDFVPLTDHRTYDQHWDPQYGSDKLLLIPGEEANGSPHAIVLGAPDVLVDGANPPGSAPFRHVQQSVWDVHSQGGAIWSQAHPDDGEFDKGVVTANGSVVGQDTVEILNIASDPDAELAYAESRWNHGYRFGVTAASDDHFREVWDIAGPGRPTTYVFAADRSAQAILDGLRAGHTTISNGTNGPFVTIETEGTGFAAMGGDEITARAGREVRLRVRVKNGSGTTLYLFASPGKSAGPLATFAVTTADQRVTVPVRVPDGSSWYRAEIRSPGALSGIDADPKLPDQLRAAASPIFVTTRGFVEPTPEIAVPAADSHEDHARFVAGSRGCFTAFADVSATDHTKHVVAEAHVDGRTTIVYRRLGGRRLFEHGFVESESFLLDLTPEFKSARFPRVAATGADVWVVWQSDRTSEGLNTSAIFVRHSADGGRHWGRIAQLSDATSRANHPAMALVTGNHPVVVWSDRAAGPFDIRAQVLGVDPQPVNISAVGKTIDPGISADARSPRFPASLFPAVAVAPNGQIIVAWQDDRFDPDPLWTGHTPPAGQPASGGTDPDNWEILASVRAPDSAAWQLPVRVSNNNDAADRHPSVVADRDGKFVVAWDTGALQSSGVNLSIRASVSADAGASWAAPVNVSLESNAMSQRPQVDLDPQGDVRVVWYDSRATDWRWQIFTARLGADAAWTAPAQLTSVSNATWPTVSRGTVVFTSDRLASRVQRDQSSAIFAIRAY